MNQIQLKACPRCHGDMVLEEWLGDAEIVCLQCGYRSAARAAGRPAEPAVAARKAA